MEFDDLPNLRGVPAEGEETSSVRPTPPPGAGISPNPVTQLVADVGPALLMQRFSAEGPPVPDAYVVSVVDDIVMPLLRAPVVAR